MDQYFKWNAILSKFSKNYMNRQFDRLINGMGQKEFDTFVKFADVANSILEDKGE